MASPYELSLGQPEQTWTQKMAKIAGEIAARNSAAVDKEARFPKETIGALAESGFFGLNLPTNVGGKGQSPRVFVSVVEELARNCASSAMIYVMHTSAAQAIANSTTCKKKDEILKKIAQGSHLTTLAFSEKGSRSQFWMPCSEITESGGAVTTHAEKSWVTSATSADSYVGAGRFGKTASALESTVYLMASKNKGVKITGKFDGLGLRGNDSAPVSLSGAAIEPDSFLSEKGKGLDMMLQVVLPWFAIGTSALAHGLCQGAIGATQAHLTNAGFDSGLKLRDLSNLRTRLAQMNMRTERSRALLGWTLAEMENPTPMLPLYVLQSRLSALETALEVTDMAMKTCGGAAFSKHLPLERYFRDARAGWVMAPTVDHLEDFVGKALTGLPLF